MVAFVRSREGTIEFADELPADAWVIHTSFGRENRKILEEEKEFIGKHAIIDANGDLRVPDLSPQQSEKDWIATLASFNTTLAYADDPQTALLQDQTAKKARKRQPRRQKNIRAGGNAREQQIGRDDADRGRER